MFQPYLVCQLPRFLGRDKWSMDLLKSEFWLRWSLSVFTDELWIATLATCVLVASAKIFCSSRAFDMIILNMVLVIVIFSSSGVSDTQCFAFDIMVLAWSWPGNRVLFTMWQPVLYFTSFLDMRTYVNLDEKSFRFPLLSALLLCID